jgi:hypothetical protein
MDDILGPPDMPLADPIGGVGNPTAAAAVDNAAATIAELPSPQTKRWVVRRKAVVVQAVHSGVLTLHEACRRYNLSVEEFLAWQRAIERYGVPGLRVTRLQIYRDTDDTRPSK